MNTLCERCCVFKGKKRDRKWHSECSSEQTNEGNEREGMVDTWDKGVPGTGNNEKQKPEGERVCQVQELLLRSKSQKKVSEEDTSRFQKRDRGPDHLGMWLLFQPRRKAFEGFCAGN